MSPSTIDLVLTNYKVNLANITADHIPVLCKADMSVDYIRVLRYNYRFADWNKFRNIINSELGSIMLSHLHNPVDIDNILNRFQEVVLKAQTESIPKDITVQTEYFSILPPNSL